MGKLSLRRLLAVVIAMVMICQMSFTSVYAADDLTLSAAEQAAEPERIPAPVPEPKAEEVREVQEVPSAAEKPEEKQEEASPGEEPTAVPKEEPAEDPMSEPAKGEPGEKPMSEPVKEEPGEKPTSEPVKEEPGEKPTSEPAKEEPAENPEAEPVKAEDDENTPAPEKETKEAAPVEPVPAVTEKEPAETTSPDAEESAREEVPEAPAPLMPAQSFRNTTGGVAVRVTAGAGVFPEGTVMKAVRVSKAAALEVAQAAAEREVEVVDAIGVDISFYDAGGTEIQPADGRSVSVSLKLAASQVLEGDHFTVLHADDDGAVEVVTEKAKADGAVFSADSFSIYVISGESEPAVATLEFIGTEGEIVSTQKVKDGETIYMPESPVSEDGIFLKWDFEPAEGFELVEGSALTAKVTKTVTVEWRPRFEKQYRVSFLDEEGRITAVKPGMKGEVITTADVELDLPSTRKLCGWYDNAEFSGEALTSVTIGEADIILYPLVKEGHYLYFETGDGGTVLAPVYYDSDEVTARPADPKRRGYVFKTWLDDQDREFGFGSKLAADTTLRADWDPSEAPYKVVFWQQKSTDDKAAADADKHYEAVEAEERTGTVGTQPEPAEADRTKSYTGFKYGRHDGGGMTIAPDGSTVLNIYYDRQLVTIEFYVPFRKSEAGTGSHYGLVGLSFVELTSDGYGRWYYYQSSGSAGTWERYRGDVYVYDTSSAPVHVLSGLYGSRLSDNGCIWPTEYTWVEDNEAATLTLRIPYEFFIPVPSSAIGGTEKLYAIRRKNLGTFSGQLHLVKRNTAGEEEGRVSLVLTAQTVGVTEKFVGYTASSYSMNGGSERPISAGESITNVPNNADLRIFYKKNLYKLSFISDHKTVRTEQIEHGILLSDYAAYRPEETPEPVPGKRYEFAGWYTDPSYINPADLEHDYMTASDLTLFAKWREEAVWIPVEIYNTAGEQVLTSSVAYGMELEEAKLPQPEEVKPEDEEWTGWVIYRNGRKVHYNFNTRITERFSLYASSKSRGAVYSVIYDPGAGSGEVTDERLYKADEVLAVKSGGGLVPPAGRVFICWSTERMENVPEHTLLSVWEAAAADHVVRLTAVYGDQPAKTELTYHSNYPDGSAEETKSEILANNSEIDLGSRFSKEGYVFAGWNTAADGSGLGYPDNDRLGIDNDGRISADSETARADLYAQWLTEVTVTVSGKEETLVYDCQEHSVSGYRYSYTVAGQAAEALPDGLTLHTDGEARVSGKNVGTYAAAPSVYAVDETGRFRITIEQSDAALMLVILKRAVTLASGSAEKEYDGQPLTKDEAGVSAGSFADGEGVRCEVTGSQTYVGESENVFTYELMEGTKQDNYEITTEYGTLRVTDRTEKYEVTLVARSETIPEYDGAEHTAEGVWSDSFEIDGLTYRVSGFATEDPKAADAGTYSNKVIEDKFAVTAPDGTDVSSQFAVSTEDGRLVIGKRTLILTADSADKTYDGTPLLAEGYKITGGSLADREELEAVVTGSQTLVGTSPSRIEAVTIEKIVTESAPAVEASSEVQAKSAAVSGSSGSNYDIVCIDGELTVTDDTDGSKVITKTHEDKTFYVGDEVTFDIHVTNIYDETVTITLTELDHVGLNQSVFENVAAGASISAKAVYKLTATDLENKKFVNTVKAAFEKHGIFEAVDSVDVTVKPEDPKKPDKDPEKKPDKDKDKNPEKKPDKDKDKDPEKKPDKDKDKNPEKKPDKDKEQEKKPDKDQKDGKTKTEEVKTGDTSPILPLTLLLVFSAALLLGLIADRRKRN